MPLLRKKYHDDDTFRGDEREQRGGVSGYSGVDPETGEEYFYARGAGYGPRGEERAKRESARRRRDMLQRMRRDAARELYGEGSRAIMGAWEGAEGDLPSALDLMGGQTESELGKAEADAQSIEQQRQALARMGNFAEGGYTAQERAMMQRIQAQQRAEVQQQQQATMQQMAMRGMQGGGAELAANLYAQQGAANRANMQGLETQAQAFNRSLQATGAQGQMAGQMRGQSFDESATRASAIDDFHRAQGAANQQNFSNKFDVRGAQSQAGLAGAQTGMARDQMLFQQKEDRKKRRGQQGNIIGDVSGLIGSFYGGGGGSSSSEG